MKLEEIMVRNVVEIDPATTVAQAAELMMDRGVGCLPVSVDGSLKGIMTDRDLLKCIRQNHDPRHCPASAHMSRPVIVLPPDEDHIVAIDVMQRRRIKRLPIAQQGKLVGIVSLSDLAALAEGEMHKIWASWTAVAGIMRSQAIQVWGGREDHRKKKRNNGGKEKLP